MTRSSEPAGRGPAGAGDVPGEARAAGAAGDGVTVLVPARNEAENLPGLLEALDAVGGPDDPGGTGGPEDGGGGLRVLVVDNGSTDGTARVAREGGARVVREPRPGYGRACQAGIAAEARRGSPPRVLAFLDADDHRGPAELPRVVEPVLDGRADLVMGRRRREDGVPPQAAAGNALVSAVLRGLYGWPGRDMGPLRAIRFRSLLELGLDHPDFGWNVQMHVRALRAGLTVREVPVRFEPRRRGTSKISGAPVAAARAAGGMLGTLVREVLRPRGR